MGWLLLISAFSTMHTAIHKQLHLGNRIVLSSIYTYNTIQQMKEPSDLS